ncbi:MAG TPA: hypothetical protein VJ990_06120 [Clostridia bacterium]|nr:hypothetical protein [Clostridia bacterium]
MIKKISLILMLSFILIVFSRNLIWLDNNIITESKDYLTENGMADTGSANIVTGIYLDYRLYDSIFETGLLLMTVSGITLIIKKVDKS